MENEVMTLTVNGVEYVRREDVKQQAEKVDGMKYVIYPTYSAGVFAGYLKKQEGQEVVMVNARRIWFWDGAASLSQLAVEGTSKPENCKFPIEVPSIILTEVIEILGVTEKAKESIKNVKVWSA